MTLLREMEKVSEEVRVKAEAKAVADKLKEDAKKEMIEEQKRHEQSKKDGMI